MKRFEGFPAQTTYCPIPDLLLGEVVPQIDDLAEVKVTLYLYWLLQRKRVDPHFATQRELLGEQKLLAGLSDESGLARELLCQGLDRAVARGSLLRLHVERSGQLEEVYLLNTGAGRRAAGKIERGEIALGRPVSVAPPPELPSIFALYEQNIGLITPLIAEQLAEAEGLYPPSWIEEAFREAVSLNKRSWRYVVRILERWATDGRQHGAGRRHPETADEDPRKFFRGKYGHIVKH